MQTITTIKQVRSIIAGWKRDGLQVALVPTMGNLHDGHLSLVRLAGTHSDRVVVSIFVNPTQFGENEDFNDYPRTLQQDSDKLVDTGADLLFAPGVAEIYPSGTEYSTRIEVPALSDMLCGASRPGHFSGVATVVNRLFNIVQPDLAIFGEKDFQQLQLIRRMVQDLAMPVQVQGAPIVREADGLAMSSRNQYLNKQERETAPILYRTLQEIEMSVRAGDRNFVALEQAAADKLASAGMRPDYVSIRRQDNLQPVSADDNRLVILAAAWLGQARLIDNIQLTL
jgi:pantoate--beta-alanine ligase